jgi:hypothetical protein
MGTKNNPGAFDCYANAHPDEPMFVLLARDKHAPSLVCLWADLRALTGEDPAKVNEARECAEGMVLWQAEHGRKTVGLGTATLAGIMGLIRMANAGIKNAPNQGTRYEDLAKMLTETPVNDIPDAACLVATDDGMDHLAAQQYSNKLRDAERQACIDVLKRERAAGGAMFAPTVDRCIAALEAMDLEATKR